jgi:hypothetical protein
MRMSVGNSFQGAKSAMRFKGERQRAVTIQKPGADRANAPTCSRFVSKSKKIRSALLLEIEKPTCQPKILWKNVAKCVGSVRGAE